ncbi:MAG: hypothetical protein NTW29_07700 [Bacteroidetes bacterium]|nr:hypothetical protein [Bacteroidota bacterium]
MKTIRHFLVLVTLTLVTGFGAKAQGQSGTDSTGLPGDHFSLQGALELFKNAASIEDFEKSLNTENNHVNNLDLDDNGETDYVKVVSKATNDAHAFILQVAVSDHETQDIAVIELEKNGKESAMIQIVGDEDIYGEEVIAEPDGGGNGAFIIENGNSNLSGPNPSPAYEAAPIIVNVWLWPSVRFVYSPAYRPWVSPWYWNHYPGWWKPWKPYRWHVWHPFHAGFHRSFAVVGTHRVIRAHAIYTPFRSRSVVVYNRHGANVNRYRVSRSRTTITGPAGRKTTIRKTTVTGPRGNKATKVRVRRH